MIKRSVRKVVAARPEKPTSGVPGRVMTPVTVFVSALTAPRMLVDATVRAKLPSDSSEVRPPAMVEPAVAKAAPGGTIGTKGAWRAPIAPACARTIGGD